MSDARAGSAVRVALLFPELLGTYGDGGNAVVLGQRLHWRGLAVDIVECHAGAPVPEACDIYLLGGGEDAPQSRAASELVASGALQRAVGAGAVVFGVCGGYQVLGTSFAVADGSSRPGLGLLDCRTVRRRGPRAVGELLADADPALGVGVLTGFENHGGATELGPGATPLARCRSGFGNATPDRTEGARADRVVGTYLHGPALARNPALADRLLEWVTGPLAPLDDADVDRLRAERMQLSRGGARRWRARSALSPLRRRGR